MIQRNRKTGRKLVICDVEGVLLPKYRYLVFEVGRNLNLKQRVTLLAIGILYQIRIISLETALRKIYAMVQGLSIKDMSIVFRNVPLLPYAKGFISELKEMGFKVALISSGLPQLIVDQLASNLEADYAFGLQLEMRNEILTGNIMGDVIKEGGKALVTQRILTQENLCYDDCVIIADDRNNAPIFFTNALKIGYNPDFLIILKSDHVVKGSLHEVLLILQGKQDKRIRSLSNNEVLREAIHAGGSLVPFLTVVLGTYVVAFLLLLTTLTYATSEFARIERRNVPIISSVTTKAAVLPEIHEFVVAPISLALGIMFSLLLFPAPFSYASVAIVSLGDSAASIFGRVFGRIPLLYNKGKYLEGSIVGFVFAFLGAFMFLEPRLAFVGAMVGMLVESLPLPINDNLSTPLVAGALLSILGLII